MQGKISVLNGWRRDWLPYFSSMFMLLFTSLHTGLVPASEELRKLQEEGNLDDDGEEDEPSDDEHYESVDGENGVNEVD